MTTCDPTSRSPFFLVGTGRCGTTMLRNLIRAHPQVHIPRETHWLPVLWHAFGQQSVPNRTLLRFADDVYMAKGRNPIDRIVLEQKADGEAFRRDLLDRLPGGETGRCTVREFQETLYGRLAESQGRSIVGDKTPDYGLCMGLLQSMWPGARFVHLFRDGRDVALSMSKVLSFRLLAAWGVNHWWALAWRKQYEQRMDEALAEQPLERFYNLWRSRVMRIWDESKRLDPGTYLEFRYERLLEQPRETLHRIADFLELPGPDGWIDEAASAIRRDNRNKNLDRPEYHMLTERFGDDLASLGFTP